MNLISAMSASLARGVGKMRSVLKLPKVQPGGHQFEGVVK